MKAIKLSLSSLTIQEKDALFYGGEDTSGLNDVFGACASPGDRSRVPLCEDLDDVCVVDGERLVGLIEFDFALELSVNGIVHEHVLHVFEINEWATRMRKIVSHWLHWTAIW